MHIPLIIGNWKMNCLKQEAIDKVSDLKEALGEAKGCVVCPPAPLLDALGGMGIEIGAQDCHPETSGAYTGDVSAALLKDLGVTYCIVGHSERRTYHLESNELVQKKAQACHQQGVIPIICIGEGQQEREAGRHLEVVKNQLEKSLPSSAEAENTVIAYEPVWAIGTGLQANPPQILEMHQMLRDVLNEKGLGKIPLLYGGSVKPETSHDILSLENVEGVLVGGASLDPASFAKIYQSV